MPAEARKHRDDAIDVAKGILVLLVVYGHFLEASIRESASAHIAYLLIYLFHMPAFVAVSGYLASGPFQVKRVLRRILLPLMIAEIAYRVIDSAYFGRGYPLTQPYWILWYLLSLSVWLFVAPYWARLPYPVATSVVVALLAGGIDWIGGDFSMSRTLVFFPFFLAGYLTRAMRPALSAWGAGLCAIVALSCLALLEYATSSSAHAWLYGQFPYEHLGEGFAEGLVLRGLHLVGAFCAVMAFFSLIPKRGRWLAWLGRHSLGVYLLHGVPALYFITYGPVGGPAVVTACILAGVTAFTAAWLAHVVSRGREGP